MSMSGTEATTAPCQSTRTSPGTSSDSLEPHRAEPEVGHAEPEVGHAERVQACMEVGFMLQRALSSDLAPSAMHSNRVRLETLRRCSYYLEVIRMDLPLGEHNYMTNSTVLHLIDPWKLQRMKKLANSQVKIQLCLLEELHEQLLKEQQGLDTALECCDLPMLMVEGESIRQRLTAALQTKADFDAMVLPGRLHSKHQLISDMGRAKVPQVRLALVLKMPVHFDKAHSFATANAATLYWHVAGSEAGPDPLEQFELRYKLLQPTCAAEGSEVGVLTCAACSAQVEGLRPDRCYEFSIKRVDSCCLVYGAWIDCIILRTVAASCAGFGGSNGYDKRRRMFQW